MNINTEEIYNKLFHDLDNSYSELKNLLRDRMLLNNAARALLDKMMEFNSNKDKIISVNHYMSEINKILK